jgi:O-acetylhomoserine/O-acetylserine sulfhydrylase-like pyridoxal-dependent enzyme
MQRHPIPSMTLLTELVCTFPTENLLMTSFALQEFGNVYSRIMNPTVDVFEKVLLRSM